eukprot:TRINITY_DN6489_c0_g1_i1.p1 TRINITY_DN6489_c0_g1~~TRINITY_DN6489_c0_g1_i1.p1  ORF type:complete len:1229 (+),score=296.41 TRINITY_DN6489_c0_g1_i1:419-3688(+)
MPLSPPPPPPPQPIVEHHHSALEAAPPASIFGALSSEHPPGDHESPVFDTSPSSSLPIPVLAADPAPAPYSSIPYRAVEFREPSEPLSAQPDSFPPSHGSISPPLRLAQEDHPPKPDEQDKLDITADLDLSNVQHSNLSFQKHATLDYKNLDGVTVLNVSGNGLEALTNLPKTLVRLDASQNRIARLQGLDDCESLEILNLRRNRLTKIDGLQGCMSLRHLFIGHNHIKKVQNLEHCVNLETLDIGYNLLTLSSSLRPISLNPVLQTLIVHGNPIADKAGRRRVLLSGFLPNTDPLVPIGICRGFGVVDKVEVATERSFYVTYATGSAVASTAAMGLSEQVLESASTGGETSLDVELKTDAAGRKRRINISNLPRGDPLMLIQKLLQHLKCWGAVEELELLPPRGWSWREKGAKWYPFDGKMSAKLTKCSSGVTERIIYDGVTYDFNFKTMTQKHAASGKIREIRPPPQDADVSVLFRHGVMCAENVRKVLNEQVMGGVLRESLDGLTSDDPTAAAMLSYRDRESSLIVRQMMECLPLVSNLCPQLKCLDNKYITARGSNVAGNYSSSSKLGASMTNNSNNATTDVVVSHTTADTSPLEVSTLAAQMVLETGTSSLSLQPPKAHGAANIGGHKTLGYSMPGKASVAMKKMEKHQKIVEQEAKKKRSFGLQPTQQSQIMQKARQQQNEENISANTSGTSTKTKVRNRVLPESLLETPPQVLPESPLAKPSPLTKPSTPLASRGKSSFSKSLGSKDWKGLQRKVEYKEVAPEKEPATVPMPQAALPANSSINASSAGSHDIQQHLESVMNRVCKTKARGGQKAFGGFKDTAASGLSYSNMSFLSEAEPVAVVEKPAKLQGRQGPQQRTKDTEAVTWEKERRMTGTSAVSYAHSRRSVRFAPGSSPPSRTSSQGAMRKVTRHKYEAPPAAPSPKETTVSEQPQEEPVVQPQDPIERGDGLRESIKAWLQGFGNDFVTLHLALKTLLVLVEEGSSKEMIRYKEIVSSCGMLQETEIPTEISLGYGITADTKPVQSPNTERDQVVAMMSQMQQTKTCLRFIFHLMDENRYKELAEYLNKVKESLFLNNESMMMP